MRILKASISQIEEAVNHPAVRKGFHPHDGWYEFPNFYDHDRRNVAYIEPNTGAVAFFHVVPEKGHDGLTYAIHFAFPPEARGKIGKEIAARMIDKVFRWQKARAIVGSPPRDNRAVRTLGVQLGFKRIPGEFEVGGVEFLNYRLRREEWALLQTQLAA